MFYIRSKFACNCKINILVPLPSIFNSVLVISLGRTKFFFGCWLSFILFSAKIPHCSTVEVRTLLCVSFAIQACFYCNGSMGQLFSWKIKVICSSFLLKSVQNQLKLKELVSYNDFKAILNDLDAVNANVFPVYSISPLFLALDNHFYWSILFFDTEVYT